MPGENLKEIGLTGYEAKSYLVLVKYGTMSAREVAKKSGVPPTRVFDTLKLLVDKGFVFLISQKPMVFQAVKPEIAIKGFIERKIKNLENLEKTSLDSLKMLEKPTTGEKIEEKIYVISGFEKMYDAVNTNIDKTKKELLVFSIGEKIPYLTEIAIRKAVKRGVTFRFITSKYDEENVIYLKKLESMGALVRYYKAEDYSIAIYDREIANIVVRGPTDMKERIATFFENKNLAKAFVIWFETIWKKGRPIKF